MNLTVAYGIAFTNEFGFRTQIQYLKQTTQTIRMTEAIFSSGRPLKEFQVNPPSGIFQDATNLPQFFSSNLLDDARVIKSFIDDPQANIRVFYYQYLKLCFEFDNPNYESYINKVQELVLNSDFSFRFPSGKNSELFNDLQFKRLLLEFFEFMSQAATTANQALGKFPVIDLVLVCFFRSLLLLAGKTSSFESYMDRDSLFEFLTSYFNIEATVHDNCMKFVETDIFVYEERPNEVYMIYIDYEKGLQHSPLSHGQQAQESVSVSQIESAHNFQQGNLQNLLPTGSNQLPEMSSNAQSREVLSISGVSSQIQQQKSILNSKNQQQNIVTNPPSQSNPSMEKKRKQVLTYMGSSDIYDFVDYTNPKTNTPSNPSIQPPSESHPPLDLAAQFQQIVTESTPGRQIPVIPEELYKKETTIDKLKEFQSPAKIDARISPTKVVVQQTTEKQVITMQETSTITQVINTNTVSIEKRETALENFSGTFNGNSNPGKEFVSHSKLLQQEAVQASIEKKREYLTNDKYGLDSVKIDLGMKGFDAYGNQYGKTGFSSNINSGYVQTSNYSSSGFTNQTFEEKMQRITNNSIVPDHNRFPPAANITNQPYMSPSGSKLEHKNRTVNVQSGISPPNKSSMNPPRIEDNFHLNIGSKICPSQQFTDSFTLEKVQEPYRSNIRSIKKRARSQRRSVGGNLMH